MTEPETPSTETAIMEPDILLPAPHVDLFKWAVIACDQFTQDRAYWEEAAQIAGGAPSALNLVLPEVYLQESSAGKRIKAIQETARQYLENGVFEKPRRGFVEVERETGAGLRRGLLAALDLECYDRRPDAAPLIRASEGTIEERLPPRIEVRRAAPLELPHVLLLIDDIENALFSQIAASKGGASKYAYDTPLMLGGGRVRGRFLTDSVAVKSVLASLAQKSCARYGISAPFLFAVGDGNHSLAAAKSAWDEYKAAHSGEANIAFNPRRYALAEIVNLYDEALRFEPIHRIINTNTGLSLVQTPSWTLQPLQSREALSRAVQETASGTNGGTRIGIIQSGQYYLAESASKLLAPSLIEPLIDKYRAARPETAVDYIHGEDELFSLCKEGQKSSGFLFPPFEKKGLFQTITKTGALPRKSFSLGEARDKRYYMEARCLE